MRMQSGRKSTLPESPSSVAVVAQTDRGGGGGGGGGSPRPARLRTTTSGESNASSTASQRSSALSKMEYQRSFSRCTGSCRADLWDDDADEVVDELCVGFAALRC